MCSGCAQLGNLGLEPLEVLVIMDIYTKLFFTWTIGFLLFWAASLELYPLRYTYPLIYILFKTFFVMWMFAGVSALLTFIWGVA